MNDSKESPRRIPNIIQKCSPELQMRIEYGETLMSFEACVPKRSEWFYWFTLS